ncbi:hypothetical protein BRC71_06330 [Halobacteriales archaeon QH_7_65_31]|nr:MAG: hypothetical protein BRC71_06330 [Halobacteriales archaeon QH_7_65_31]
MRGLSSSVDGDPWSDSTDTRRSTASLAGGQTTSATETAGSGERNVTESTPSGVDSLLAETEFDRQDLELAIDAVSAIAVLVLAVNAWQES